MHFKSNSFFSKSRFLLILILYLLFLDACDSTTTSKAQKELLIYCGITMVKPITEIAKIIEEQENIKVNISQGGSKDLYKSLKHSMVGDLYLPGSSSYRDRNLKDGLLKEFQLVGYNQAAMLVQKNNPKDIKADLHQLLRDDLSVVMCNPESGSIGRETKKILTNNNLYDKVLKNIAFLNSDSRTLNNSLKNNKADLIINWRATAFFDDNIDHIDVIDLPTGMVKPNKLQINLLSFSKHPEIAKRFMSLSASEKGQEIFRRYGFLDKNMNSNSN